MTFLGAKYVGGPIFENVQTRFDSETVNLRTRTLVLPSQRWELEVGLETEAFGDSGLAGRLAAHRDANGSHTKFNVAIPQLLGVTRGHAASYSLQAKATAGAKLVRVGHTSAGTPIGVGRFVTFSGHAKLYQVTSVSKAGTVATVGVFPTLRADVAASESMTADGVQLSCTHHPDTVGRLAYQNAAHFSATLIVREWLGA